MKNNDTLPKLIAYWNHLLSEAIMLNLFVQLLIKLHMKRYIYLQITNHQKMSIQHFNYTLKCNLIISQQIVQP